MSTENLGRQAYYDLMKHNITQFVIFFSLLFVIMFFVFSTLLPFIQFVVIEKYLEGQVVNTGKSISLTKELDNIQKGTDYYTQWAIDIYQGTPQEARYWFNPILALFFPITLFSTLLSLMITALLPIRIGLMRHKIEREIISILDSWHYKIYGKYSEDSNKAFEEKLRTSNIFELLDLSSEWEILPEDIRYFRKVLEWRISNSFFRLINSWTSIKFYLRFYFTDKYSNVVLGLVYIGAAILIIIIGMRGLKFIPSTQPSLVFFALGLEFTVLITYAFTVIYSRSENESAMQISSGHHESTPLLSDEFGNGREVENMLRAFLFTDKKRKN
jgi:hypothetical protein